MPASKKMLKNKAQAANRAAGIGDEQGRLPMAVKKAEVTAKCALCSQEIRVTKTNTEHKTHFESRHPASSFAQCWPGIFDPTAAAVAAAAEAAAAKASASSSSSASAASASASAGGGLGVFGGLEGALEGLKLSSEGGGGEGGGGEGADASAVAAAPAAAPKKKVSKPKPDLSFLDAALPGGGKKKA